MQTLGALIDHHKVDVLDYLDRDVTVPVLTGLQFQGDVGVVPAPKAKPATSAVPAQGIAVVRGESGGNTHMLLADGQVFFDPRPASVENLVLGILTVTDDATAYLAHPEHAYSGIGAGTYEIRRQREQADELRMVAD